MPLPRLPSPRVARYVVVMAALLSAACGTAYVSPILLDDEVAFDPALLGSWEEADPDEDRASHDRAVITGDSASGYRVDYSDADGEHNRFDARLGRFAGRRVLELRPARPEHEEGSFHESLILRLYGFVVIERLTPTELQFNMIRPDSMTALLEREPTLTPWFVVDDERTVLTAETNDLRVFLRRFLARPGVFEEEPARFVRQGAPPP